MSIASTLETVMNAGNGILGIALMDRDGIPIAETVRAGAEGILGQGEISTLAIEFERVLGEADKAADAVQGGSLRETQVVMARFSLVFARVADGLTLVLVLEPDGNLGKARYLIRRNLLEIRQQVGAAQQSIAD